MAVHSALDVTLTNIWVHFKAMAHSGYLIRSVATAHSRGYDSLGVLGTRLAGRLTRLYRHSRSKRFTLDVSYNQADVAHS